VGINPSSAIHLKGRFDMNDVEKFTFGISATCARGSNMFRGICLFGALILPIACGSPAHADSKSAAEFMLKICSDAMDDFAKVTAVAHDSHWVEIAIPEITLPVNKTTRSAWMVSQGDETFLALIWVSLLREEAKLAPQKGCSVTFPGKNVNRDEFFNVLSSSLDLEFAKETQSPQIRIESYEVKNYRPKKIELSMTSNKNGETLVIAIMQEMPFFALPPRPAQETPPEVAR
jgi:hypothetical protein